MGKIQDIVQKIHATNSVDSITSMYLGAWGRKRVAEHLGISYNSVGHVMRALGVTISRHQRRSIHKYDGMYNNPFTPDTVEGQYMLGYFIGDGSIRENGVNLSSSNLEHLTLLRNIWDKSLDIHGPRKNNYTIECYDTEIRRHLLSLGIVPRKSYEPCSLTFPITWSFILGVFDSDGCAFTNRGKLHIQLSGHPSYMQSILSFIDKPCRVEYRKPYFMVCTYSSNEATAHIIDNLYKDPSVFMECKYNKIWHALNK